jgi:hypothetical protein
MRRLAAEHEAVGRHDRAAIAHPLEARHLRVRAGVDALDDEASIDGQTDGSPGAPAPLVAAPADALRARRPPVIRPRAAKLPSDGDNPASRGGWAVIVRHIERGPEPRRRVLVPARRTEVPAVVVDVAGRESQSFHREPGRRDVARALVAIDAAARCAAENRGPPMPRLESRIGVAPTRQRESAVSPAAVAIRSMVSSTPIATSGLCSRAMQGRYPAQKLENEQAVGTLRALRERLDARTAVPAA